MQAKIKGQKLESPLNHQQMTDNAKDLVLAAPAVPMVGTSAFSENTLLTWVTIVYLLVLIAYTVHKWWISHKKIRAWEEALKNNPRTPPPREFRKKDSEFSDLGD